MKESFADESSLFAAFKRVRKNKGCAGVDRVTISRFEKDLFSRLTDLSQEVKRKRYLPLPLLKILVDKGHGETRRLCIPTVRDRVLQTSVLREIEPIIEKELEHCSYAYRKGRSVQQAVQQVHIWFMKGYRWVVDADIDAFFDNVNHEKLIHKIEDCLTNEEIFHLIKQWIKAEIWDGNSIEIAKKGIPPGSPISPILANLFLDELDENLLNEGFKPIRYADDFLILCKDRDRATQALEITNEILEQLSLKLDEGDIRHFDQGFKFLGFVFARSVILKSRKLPMKKDILFYPPPLDLVVYYKNRRAT